MKMTKLLGLAALLLASGALGVASAQAATIPFQVVAGTGTLDQFPSPPENPSENHYISSGSLIFGDQVYSYTVDQASFEILGPVPGDPSSVYFQSDVPARFDAGDGNVIEFHYGRTDFGAPQNGVATLSPTGLTSPGGAPLFDVIFLATFNPVPGSGTGVFADVVSGAFFMTAVSDNVDVTGVDIPYNWSSDVGGYVTIPEPSSLLIAGLACLGLVRRGRR